MGFGVVTRGSSARSASCQHLFSIFWAKPAPRAARAARLEFKPQPKLKSAAKLKSPGGPGFVDRFDTVGGYIWSRLTRWEVICCR